MKTSLFLFASLVLSCVSFSAEAPEREVVPSAAVSARDGFTHGGTAVIYTRNGISQKVEKEVVLENGVRVRADGTVTLANGEKAALRNNQILTLQGVLEEVALTPEGVAPVTSGGAPLKKQGEEVGISANDGISVSGKEALVTRNGVSERLTKELRLNNGTRVKPDGSVTLPDGTQITLKVDQVLTFDGVVRDVPAQVNPTPGPARTESQSVVVTTTPVDSDATVAVGKAAAIQDGIVFHDGLPYLIRNGRALIIDSTLVPQGQILTNDGKFRPIPPTFTDFPAVTVRKSTEQQTLIGEPGSVQPPRRDTTTPNGPGRSGFRRE
jgi:hypothetical protein